MTTFRLPDLGEGLQEAEIVAWHVSEGDHVIADQPLVSVETDKAVVEVPAPFSGTVDTIIAGEGEFVSIGAALVEITTGEVGDKGAIVGDISSTEINPAKDLTFERQVGNNSQKGMAVTSIRAAPAVRKLARDKGVDITKLTGSGPGGTILSSDVLSALPTALKGNPIRGVRKSMAHAMERSRDRVAPATITDLANISGWSQDEHPTVRLVEAIAASCAKEPSLNAWFDGQKRQLHQNLDVAIAVDTPDGLFAPVLRSAEACENLAERIADLQTEVMSRTIRSDALRGGTFTLSNFGMLGGKYAVLVVSPPQVGILGAGRIHEACLVENDQPVVRRVIPLSLSFDHRAVTGGEAARFLSAVCADLERPSKNTKG